MLAFPGGRATLPKAHPLFSLFSTSFYLLTLFLLLLLSRPLFAVEIELTPAEKELTLPGQSIEVAVMYDFVPFSYVEDGTFKGFVADLLKLIEKKTGATLNPRIGEWSDNLDRLNRKRIDAIADISFKPERTSFALYTTPYFEIPIVVFTDKAFGRYQGLADLSGKKVGVLKDIFYLAELSQLEDIRISTYDDYEQLTRAVALGEIEVGLQNLTSGLYYASKNAYINIHVAGEFTVKNLGREDLRFGVRVDRPAIQSLLQKGMDSITPMEWRQLTDHWLGISPADISGKQSGLTLTPEEREFVKNNPIIRVQNETNYQPYNFFEDDLPRGHSIDLMQLVAQKAGFEVEFVSGYSWQDYMQMIKNGELDVMVNIAYSEQRDEYLKFTSPYLRQAQGIYYKKNEDAINSLDRLEAATIAVPEGFFIYDVLSADNRFKVLPTRDSLESLMMVSTGQADATIESMTVAEHLLHKYNVPGMAVTSPPQMATTEPISLRLAVSQTNPMLHQILEKAINSLSDQEMRKLQYKWTASPTESQHYLHLTSEELDWMENRAAVRICTVGDNLPYEKTTEDGLHLGAFADLLEIMRKNAGMNVRLVTVQNYREAMQQLRSGGCDMVSRVAPGVVQRDVGFSQPLLESPLVIATRLDEVYVDSIAKIMLEKVAVVGNSHIHAFLEYHHPDLQLMPYQSMQAALNAVAEGQAFGVIDTLPAISRMIATDHRTDIKISGELVSRYPTLLATLNDNATLLQIINKAIQSVTPEQFEQAANHWLQTPVLTEPANYLLVKQIGAGAAALVGLIFLWNRKLSKLNREIHESRDQLMQVHEELKEKNRLLEQLSTTDQLTGLKNRHYLEGVMQELVKHANRETDPQLSLLLMDIDHFKQVNDQYGHHRGDAVLTSFAELLREAGRDKDVIARWGGEEFLVVCPDTSPEEAHQLAWNMLTSIRQHRFEEIGHCTASIGISNWQSGDDYDILCRRADDALYQAKEMGRNRVCTQILSETTPSVHKEAALSDA